jgi:hypothetical protein
VGGVETATVGDARAKELGGSKMVAQRAGEPTFDVVVELGLNPNGVRVARVILDTAGAVDAVLRGEQVPVQVRRREPDGELVVESSLI